ncbi:MAG: carbohydrate kinase family protein [Methylobacteriaceae bacterium]|nr:carbohydrate kinase family protein [Methylobacteriaceae bacterium]MBV9701984.1 carbohydrate kinase family protein [Methylobacteriaceae bacterium]
MAGRRGIITGGTWCLDRNKIVDFWPPEDAVSEVLSEEARGGGSACNLATDIKKLDPALPVETIGLVGDDADGRLLRAEASAHGIDCAQLAVTDRAPTHYTDAYASRRSGRRTHIYNPGAAALLAPEHFNFGATNARILHLGLPGIHKLMDAPSTGNASGWVSVLKQARAAGLATNLELCSIAPERIAALVRPCLPHLDLLIVNDTEIGAIAGRATVRDDRTDLATCEEAARQVLAAGAMHLVAVHFPSGALVAARDGSMTRRPSVGVPEAEVVGANGAGDAFAAGMLYGWHEGWGIAEALALAHAAAAASLRGASTTGTVEGWRDCLRLAEKWGWREWPR